VWLGSGLALHYSGSSCASPSARDFRAYYGALTVRPIPGEGGRKATGQRGPSSWHPECAPSLTPPGAVMPSSGAAHPLNTRGSVEAHRADCIVFGLRAPQGRDEVTARPSLAPWHVWWVRCWELAGSTAWCGPPHADTSTANHSTSRTLCLESAGRRCRWDCHCWVPNPRVQHTDTTRMRREGDMHYHCMPTLHSAQVHDQPSIPQKAEHLNCVLPQRREVASLNLTEPSTHAPWHQDPGPACTHHRNGDGSVHGGRRTPQLEPPRPNPPPENCRTAR
jgi:hypothetical protein